MDPATSGPLLSLEGQLEQLLPSGLRSAMLPIELQNAQLLLALVRSRHCEHKLRAHNSELRKLSRATTGKTTDVDQGMSPAGDAPDALQICNLARDLRESGEGGAMTCSLQDELAINLAEIIALFVMLRLRGREDGTHDLPAEKERQDLRTALGACSASLVLAEEALAGHCEQEASGPKHRDRAGLRAEAQELRELEATVWQRCHDEFSQMGRQCLSDEQVVLSQAVVRLEEEEQHTDDQLDARRQVARKEEHQTTELHELFGLREHFEEQEQAVASFRDECASWDSRAKRCAGLRQELSDRARAVSGHLEEEALALQIQFGRLRDPVVCDDTSLREKHQRATEEAELHRPKYREEAEELSQTLSSASELRRSLASACAERSAAANSELDAMRDVKRSRKRNAGIREALKREMGCVAELRESSKKLEAEDLKLLRSQRQDWREEQLQKEGDRMSGVTSLAAAVRSETTLAKEEADVSRKLRVELREMRAKQQHWVRQRKLAANEDGLRELLELEHDVQQRVSKRERQLQELRSLSEL